MTKQTKPGYHLTPITRGKYGQISKIQEELDELKDAREQGCRVMELVELSDIICAIKGYIKENFSDINFSQILLMAEMTERAWANGHRK